MACGIIKFNDILIRADKVVCAFQDDDDVTVCVGEDEDLTVVDCSLDRFYDEWRRALTY